MSPEEHPTELNREECSAGSTITQDDWQDKEASRDSQLKAVFDEEMGKHEKNPFTFRKAAVLLLSWAEEFDDLHTGAEVDNLEHVFKNIFNFETRRASLGHVKKKAQVQVNLFLSQFVSDYDDHNTLLIVYYAGHGWRGESKDGLMLVGNKLSSNINSKLSADGSELGQIVWNSADSIIKDNDSHVLVIFDCCHAGALKQSFRGGPFRAFEYLAATTKNGTTRQPGPHSFTAALICALKSLAESGKSFPIPELLVRITKVPEFPEGQKPRFYERPLDGVSGRRSKIMLAPLNSAVEVNEPQMEDDTGDQRQSAALGLRFVFQKDLSDDLVRNLAAGIHTLVSSEDFPSTRVLWDGSSPNSYENFVVAYYAHKWKLQSRKRSSKTTVTLVDSLPRIETSMLPVVPGESIGLSVTTPDHITSDVDFSMALDAEHFGTDTALTTPSESDSGLERTPDRQSFKHVCIEVGNVELADTASSKNGTTRQMARGSEPEFADIYALLSLKIRILFRRFIAWVT